MRAKSGKGKQVHNTYKNALSLRVKSMSREIEKEAGEDDGDIY
jgi:hypothetical protein